MQKRGIPQETLKVIACLTMLLDHIGAMFVRGYTLRIIGRIAFPIYCFLLAEGAFYTRNPMKYAFRLAIGMLLSEIPFDFALQNSFTWAHQSVMVTLLLGFAAIEIIQHTPYDLVKILTALVFFFLGEYWHTDYGGYGVLLIICFSQSRGNLWLQTLLLTMVTVMMNSLKIPVMGYRIPIEMFAVLAMVPIGCYSGKKAVSSTYVQWGFYLFYPVHLAVLCLVRHFM